MKRLAAVEVEYCDKCPHCSDVKRPYCAQLKRDVWKMQYETEIAIPDDCPLPFWGK
jgi:hypothetical protein